MATHSSILVWRIPWTEEPGRLQSMGLKELDTTYQLKRERDGIWNCETNFFTIMNTSALIFHSPAKAEVLIYSNKLEYTQRHTYTQIHTCPSRVAGDNQKQSPCQIWRDVGTHNSFLVPLRLKHLVPGGRMFGEKREGSFSYFFN